MIAGLIIGVAGATFAVLMVLLGRVVQRHVLRRREIDPSTTFVTAMGALILAAYAGYLLFGQ